MQRPFCFSELIHLIFCSLGDSPMNVAACLTLSASLLAFAVPAAAAQAPAPATAPAEQSAHDRLFQLFKDSDEGSLKRNPINALFRGDMRYADRLGDFITDQYYAAERAAAESDLTNLHAIPRDQLNETDQLAYDVFEFNTKDTLRGLQPDMLALTAVRPINHFFGIHTFY